MCARRGEPAERSAVAVPAERRRGGKRAAAAALESAGGVRRSGDIPTFGNLGPVSKTLSVVIAEDEALIRLDLKEMLEEEGYLVAGEAGDGAAAVDLAQRL